MKRAWNSYRTHAWGADEVSPISGGSHSATGDIHNMGLTIVDALDTLMIMGMTEEVAMAREWVETSLRFDHVRHWRSSGEGGGGMRDKQKGALLFFNS